MKVDYGKHNFRFDSDLWFKGKGVYTYLSWFLRRTQLEKPGPAYEYNNTNFAICQAIVNNATKCLHDDSSHYYMQYVSEHVLKPMNIDTEIFNTCPDAEDNATLSYGDAKDLENGTYWEQIDNVAAAGYIASVEEVIKFLIGVRNHVVLDEAATKLMLHVPKDQANQNPRDPPLGWYYKRGQYSEYFFHNGLLQNHSMKDEKGNKTPGYQCLSAGIMRSEDGYDCVLFINSGIQGIWQNVDRILLGAFGEKNGNEDLPYP